jgi:lactosylceramide 4-alpha-galactosyltransferase
MNDPKRSPFIRDNDKAFFIETSGNGGLNYRQACAVESLAFHNPNLTVHVLFTDVKINSSLATLQKLVEKYTNVQLVSLNVDEYMAGTLMEHWYHCTDWRKGSYHVNNLSNALRLLTVYKYGGYYFDLDIISVRSVTNDRNFVAAVDREIVNNNAIHADLKHPFIELAIKDFIINFRQIFNNTLSICISVLVNRVKLSSCQTSGIAKKCS